MAEIRASDIIRQAYLLAQVWDPGDEVPGVEANEGLLMLNTLLQEWSSMGNFIPAYSTQTFNITQGVYSYSSAVAITDILEQNIVDTNNIKYRMAEANLQQFNLFNFNNLQQRPNMVYVAQNTATPYLASSTVYVYPTPDASYTLNLYTKKVLPELEYSDVMENLPLNYFKALKYQLARDLADVYLTVLSQRFDTEYNRIIANLKQSNSKDLSVQINNQFNTWRRFRPWNIYVG